MIVIVIVIVIAVAVIVTVLVYDAVGMTVRVAVPRIVIRAGDYQTCFVALRS